jgi:hypothetical protein
MWDWGPTKRKQILFKKIICQLLASNLKLEIRNKAIFLQISVPKSIFSESKNFLFRDMLKLSKRSVRGWGEAFIAKSISRILCDCQFTEVGKV